MASHEEYARRIHANGAVTRYRTREEYQRGRFAAAGSMAAQRSGINRAVGGRVV